MTRVFRAFAALVIGFFLYATAVQYNDRDPIPWMALYLGAAILTGLWLAKRFPRRLALAFGAGSIVMAGVLLPGVIKEQSLVDLEEGREMLGLLIVGMWMIGLAAWAPLRVFYKRFTGL